MAGNELRLFWFKAFILRICYCSITNHFNLFNFDAVQTNQLPDKNRMYYVLRHNCRSNEFIINETLGFYNLRSVEGFSISSLNKHMNHNFRELGSHTYGKREENLEGGGI